MNRDIDTMIAGLAPITDRRAGELLTDETAADLADRITAHPAERNRRRPLRLIIGVPLATAAAVCAGVALAATIPDDDDPRPGKPTHDITLAAAALTVTPKGEYIEVRVRDPLADPERYRTEFAALGLDVSLNLVPASPSIVGTVVMMSTSKGTGERDITTLTAKGECETGGGGDQCPVGIRVRTDFKGKAEIVFGRAARPGEQYGSSAPVTAPGEAMHGMTFRNHRVSEVLAALKKRDVTVPEYRSMTGNTRNVLRPGQVPPTWYVHDGVPWAKDQVLLFVGPTPSR
ncbi:hypothetical protein [Spirillospora sp. NPDC048823]|uniref:hypothetical protein n=1 Tax=unclassified Spirillospora TaxID=2642701 RepID=UPI00371B9D79